MELGTARGAQSGEQRPVLEDEDGGGAGGAEGKGPLTPCRQLRLRAVRKGEHWERVKPGIRSLFWKQRGKVLE